MHDRQLLQSRILELLSTASEPTGSGALTKRLAASGLPVSQPTVSRALEETDRLRVTEKRANQGRVLTEEGMRFLQELRKQSATARLTDTQLARVGKATLHELHRALVARRVLEREAARLAAEHATERQIAQMWRLLELQRSSIASPDIAAESAIEFHEAFAEASGNRFLAAALHVIRTSTHNIRSLMLALGTSIGGDSYPDHVNILRAIAARDAAEAERLAGSHMNDFIRYVNSWISGFGHTGVVAADGGDSPASAGLPPC